MNNIVIDTNVFVAALMSKRGASNKLLRLVGTGFFDISLSVSLVLEYEDASKRFLGLRINLTEQDIGDIIDYLCSVAIQRKIYFLWRPVLRDPRDDLVLELAVSAGCEFIVTYNVRDFHSVGKFGIKAIPPKEFLKVIGALP